MGVYVGTDGDQFVLGWVDNSDLRTPWGRISRMSAIMNVFLLEDSEKHWICAEDEADAFEVYRDVYDDPEDEFEVEVTQLEDNETLTIRTDDEDPIIKTAAEWAASEERGLIASTAY